MPEEKPNQAAQVHGHHNIVVQIAGDGSRITVGLPHLTLIPPANRAPRRERLRELDLLNPYGRSVPLVGRDADMQSLWDWLHSPNPISVRTLKGRAGAGKTRLAIELIERLGTEQPGEWWAGFAQGREMRRFSGQQNLADWGWAKPTLVVVDYAASLLEPLRDWLRDLAQNPARSEDRPLRLLLLERDAEAGEGWLQILCSGGQSDAGVPELFDPLEPKRLDRLDTAAKRRAVLGEMLVQAAALDQGPVPKMPAPGASPAFERQLEQPQWEDPLYLMMAALLSLRSDLVAVLQLPRTELALRLVDHEAKRLAEGAPSLDAERLRIHLAAFAAMGGGLTQEMALAVAEEECRELRLDPPGGVGALVERVHEVLPAPDRGIASIAPDILAEALLLRAMSYRSSAQQEAAVLRAVKRLGRGVIPFLLRTIQDFATDACAALLQQVKPLDWIERLIEQGKADDLALLATIEMAMPQETILLREKAVEVGELLVVRVGLLIKNHPTEELRAEEARLLNNLAVRLRDLGRREEALEQAEKAVRIRERLAEARPDAFLPDWATSLNNLATMLRDLGRREEALEQAEKAARIYGQLAEARPDAFLPDWATSLNNLANRLRDLGRREEALEQAEKAVRIREQLAEARPDAFLPDWATSLNNLANMLRDLGRREEALEQAEKAARIYGQLAEARPDAFLPDWAMSLNNLANRLSELGRREEALEQAEKAVRIREQLAEARPDAFLPDWAMSLNNLANILSDLGRREEALEWAEKAVRIYGQLAEARPDAFLPDWATSLNNLANMLSELGRREAALEQAEKAVRIYGQLAEARPDAFRPDLATSCGARGAILTETERHREAAGSFAQGIRALRPCFQKVPRAFAPVMSNLCEGYFAALEKAQLEPDMEMLAPVREVFQKLKQSEE